jgi:hypothetical protein
VLPWKHHVTHLTIFWPLRSTFCAWPAFSHSHFGVQPLSRSPALGPCRHLAARACDLLISSLRGTARNSDRGSQCQ